MAQWEVRRGAASAELLLSFAAELDVPTDRCLRGTGIGDAARLSDPDAEIASWQELRLIRNLVAALGHVPALGVLAGRRYHLTTYGALGFGVLGCATMVAALEFGMRFRALAFGFCPLTADDSAVVVDDQAIPASVRTFVAERDVTALVTLVADLGVGERAVSRVEFARPRPPYAAVYPKLLGVEVTFDAGRNSVVLDGQALLRGLPQASERARRAAERDCLALLDRRRAGGGVTGQVRGLLRASESAMPGIEQVAAELLTSTRTLRRRLAAEGTTFRDVLAQVRASIADDALAQGTESVASIARRLGYSESAAFVHAFKRRHGVTPSTYRKSHQ